ncbi:hypothetical protein MSAN_01384300 [Mycena sanguinolenta]|uniref:Uncharacterized protein n=1 Tax=Mycena sanguinolenta TaxID=230812 RepID=A0A8H6Y9M5_9AGAR|nr:hypothetical protein MSAN_01384300 [Mycena sanguinolenta]
MAPLCRPTVEQAASLPPTSSDPTGNPFPTQSPLPGGGGGGSQGEGSGGGGGGSGGGGGGGGIQSSLYLYTFLATLILLLSVSSAIVIRSLLLRRRHRRMVAEAIANGTWIPPARRVKVDLRKKPRLRDAWVEPPLLRGEKEIDWDAIMPFAASYSPAGRAPSPHRIHPPHPPETPPRRRFRYLPRVRVAVLVAMPAPGMFSASEPAQTPTWARAPSWDAYLPPPDDDDEVGLPHLEMGVASVGVVAAHEDGDGTKEPPRDSEDGPST